MIDGTTGVEKTTTFVDLEKPEVETAPCWFWPFDFERWTNGDCLRDETGITYQGREPVKCNPPPLWRSPRDICLSGL